METTFPITHDREFLRHFLSRFRIISLSPEMVETLEAASKTDPYAAYGYGRWLSCVNPEKDSLDKAEALLLWAMQEVPDAKTAVAVMHYEGTLASGESNPALYAFLMQEKPGEWSELRQVTGLENGIYGEHGIKKDPALVADILRNQIAKHPDVDTLYYELLGWALLDDEPEAAEKAFRTVVERGDEAGYFALANLLRRQGRAGEAGDVAAEGARKGDFRCRRLWAQMDQEDFEKLPPERQEALHKELAEGLDYAIARHDRFACYSKGCNYYLGELGFEKDPVKALEPLRRGLEMGDGRCAWLLAVIQESGELPAEFRMTPQEVAFLRLQAARLGEEGLENMQEVAKAYVCGLLPEHDEEIEKFRLKTFMDAALEEDDGPDATGVLTVFPEGFYYAQDSDEELDLEELASWMGARGFDVVHFSPALTRISRALCLEDCHVAMLVDKDGIMKDLPDNMTGTIVYGHGVEMRGPVAFVLETDKGYELRPLRGLQRTYMLLEMLRAVTGDLIRQPTSGELERLGVPEAGGNEEYDDDEVSEAEGVDGIAAGEWVEEAAADGVDGVADGVDGAADGVDGGSGPGDVQKTEPKEMTVPLSELDAALKELNLCRDTLFLVLPDEPRYKFADTEDLFYPIKDRVEENIGAHGGCMIDEWRFVDDRQVPLDIRSRVRFK